ncbi:MAG: formate dehydrogenase accessory protein FdhE [Aquificaceae bacterium]|nr:formate dehydrogenase accessory protein FdhE [Aquificaceae bacterium]
MRIFRLKEKEYAIERARVLKVKHPEAHEVLGFYCKVLEYQKEIYQWLEDKEPSWRKGMDWLYSLMELCLREGPTSLAERVEELRRMERESLKALVEGFLVEKTAEERDRFLFLAFLNPFYERIAEGKEVDRDGWLKTMCPVCGFKPHVSYIADRDEMEGGRFLVCVLCGTDWTYNRNKCANCGNEEDGEIDYYYEDGRKAVQLQSCQRCGYYMKLVDLRLDGLAVPQVDDVATLSLDLWAQERGFKRFEKNILGL